VPVIDFCQRLAQMAAHSTGQMISGLRRQ